MRVVSSLTDLFACAVSAVLEVAFAESPQSMHKQPQTGAHYYGLFVSNEWYNAERRCESLQACINMLSYSYFLDSVPMRLYDRSML